MFTTFYPPYNFGGDGIGIQRLARALVNRGHEVTVVHDADAYNSLARNPNPTSDIDDGVKRVELRSGVGLLSPLLTQQTGTPVLNRRAISRIIENGKFDVVWFHNVSLIGGPGLLTLGGDAVTIYEAHEHWLVCPTHVLWRHNRERCTGKQCLRCTLRNRRPPQAWRYTGLLQRRCRAVDAFIAKSDFSRKKHAEFGFEFPMNVVPYFLPDPPEDKAPPASPPHPRPFFLFVGRLEKIKGLDDVIPVFADYPEADFLIAGDGEYSEVLKRIAGGSTNVHFLGRVAPDTLTAYYRHAIGLIVPSVCFETFGIILIEAFRQGTPVLARHLGPFPELVEQSGGGETFVTADELRQAMDRFRNDSPYRDGLSRSATTAFREKWSADAVIPQYLDVVRIAAEKKGRDDIVRQLSEESTE